MFLGGFCQRRFCLFKSEVLAGAIRSKHFRGIKNYFAYWEFQEKTKEPKSAKRDKFHGRDYKRLLHKAEKREERLNELKEKNPEKAEKIEENIQWNRALERAKGNKVKVGIIPIKSQECSFLFRMIFHCSRKA